MNDAIIVGQYPFEAIKALNHSDITGFMTETDLSIVSWPLSQIQLNQLSSPICEKGNHWVIATQEDFLKVQTFLLPYKETMMLQRLASILSYYRVRQHLNINGSGYSQVERKIVKKLAEL